MTKKPTQKIFQLNTVVGGQVIAGKVAFSPAPTPGILTEVARFEAERILKHLIAEDIASGRLPSAGPGANETPGSFDQLEPF